MQTPERELEGKGCRGAGAFARGTQPLPLPLPLPQCLPLAKPNQNQRKDRPLPQSVVASLQGQRAGGQGWTGHKDGQTRSPAHKANTRDSHVRWTLMYSFKQGWSWRIQASTPLSKAPRNQGSSEGLGLVRNLEKGTGNFGTRADAHHSQTTAGDHLPRSRILVCAGWVHAVFPSDHVG